MGLLSLNNNFASYVDRQLACSNKYVAIEMKYGAS